MPLSAEQQIYAAIDVYVSAGFFFQMIAAAVVVAVVDRALIITLRLCAHIEPILL